MKEVYFTPTQAWLGSLKKVLLWPLIVWVLIAIMGFPFLCLASVLYLVAGIVGMVVHFIAYMVIGLFIYEICWRSCPVLWTWELGLPLGMILGGFTTATLVFLLDGTPSSLSVQELFLAFMVGALYGFLTAAAAIYTDGREPGR